MRKYESSHPWITFQVNLADARCDLWTALGEAASKCEHLAGVPLTPEVSKKLHALYLAKGLQATTAIEGNTLSEKEVLRRLEGEDLGLPPSQEYLQQEVDNIFKAVKEIDFRIAEGADMDLTVPIIKHYNEMVLAGLKVDDKTIPGEIRQHGVAVGNAYHGAPAEDCEYLLQRMCEWLNQGEFCPKDDSAIVLGVIRAVLAHLYIAWIHPFGDGNGRTARLVELQILTAAGAPSDAAHLLSNHYNLTRSEYYRQLQLASNSNNSNEGLLSFIMYAVSGFVDGLREQIKVVQQQQREITWRDYLREAFEDQQGKAEQRRYLLIKDISALRKPVPLAKVSEVSPRVAVEYAKRSRNTLPRDLLHLQEMNLLKIEHGECRANLEILDAFLPFRKPSQSQSPPPPLLHPRNPMV